MLRFVSAVRLPGVNEHHFKCYEYDRLLAHASECILVSARPTIPATAARPAPDATPASPSGTGHHVAGVDARLQEQGGHSQSPQ